MGIKNKINNFLKIIRKPKTIWLVFVSFITSFFGLTLSQINYAQADIFGFLSDIGSKVVTFPIVLMGEIVSFVAGNIVILEGKILDTIVSDSLFTKLLFVQKGWAAARDIANLFFIVILIYIAFAIILRLQKMDAKKLLFKVITIAIIINFSLMIGGMIIDFSQVLFRFFVFGGLKEGVSFSTGLANSVRLQDYWSAAKENLGSDSSLNEETLSFGNQVLVRITQALTKATLMSIAALAFGALAITLVVRNIWLWVLLILAPIAWFVSIVPLGELSSLGKKWWSNFIKWVLIAPVMGFFIYLVLMMGSTKVKLINTTVESGSDVFSKQFNLSNILQFIVVIGLMVGSLMAGQSLGSSAAGSALGMVNKAKKGTQKWMGRKAMQSPPARGVGNVLMGMGNIPLIGGAFKRAGMATQRGTTAAKGEDLKKAQDRLKYMTDDELKKNLSMFNKREMEAAFKKLGADKLNKEEQYEAMQKIFGQVGASGMMEAKPGYEKEFKDLQKAHPYWTDEFKKNAEKIKIEVEFRSAESEFNKVKESGRDAGSAEYKNAESKYKSKEATYTANKKDIESAKATVVDKFKDLDASKIAIDFKESAFGNSNSAEFNALAVTLAEKPFKDGLGKTLQKVSIKDKDGRIDALRTSRIKRDLVMKTAGHIYLANGMGSDGLDAVEKAFKKPLSGSPSAHASGYTHKDINEYLKGEFGAEIETSEGGSSESNKKQQAGFYRQENYKGGSTGKQKNQEKNEEEDEDEEEEETKTEGEKEKGSEGEKKEGEEGVDNEESKEEKP
jgi:hypothetical protein